MNTLTSDMADFENFDNGLVYSRFEKAQQQLDTLNFIIDYDTPSAVAALDVGPESIQRILKKEVKLLWTPIEEAIPMLNSFSVQTT